MYGSKWIRIGSIFAAIGVACGALGAHALKTHLTADTTFNVETTQMILDNWSTAVQYLLIHSIAIILTGLIAVNVCSKLLTYAGSFFTAGIIGFSGGLLIYNATLVISGTKILPIVIAAVPLGGISFIIGWCCLAASLWTGNTCSIKTSKADMTNNDTNTDNKTFSKGTKTMTNMTNEVRVMKHIDGDS